MPRPGDEGCTACAGGAIPCKGGGNLGCRKRDPHPARIALILDSYGGARTIVGTRRAIKENTRQDEIARIVPGLAVHEPIAWNDIPVVIARARLEFERWLDTLPNLTEDEDRSVRLYRLRKLENPPRSCDLQAMVET
jgi:hypothetical protein